MQLDTAARSRGKHGVIHWAYDLSLSLQWLFITILLNEHLREREAIKTDKKCNLHEVLLYANSSDSDLPQRFKKKTQKKHEEEV